MNLTIHRGTHEIGGTCVEIQSKRSRIIIDIGIPLEENGERFDAKKYRRLTGPELVKAGKLPDVKGLYKWDRESKPVNAILISHAHLDHYGYLPYVNTSIPVFASAGCKEIMGIAHYFGQSDYDPKNVRVKKSWKYFNNIPDFAVKPYLVDHSAADAFAYLIKAEGKRVFYSGDFRGHGKKKMLFENMLKRPPHDIDVLLLEGTGIEGERDGEKESEQETEEELVRLFDMKKQLIIFSCSHQNIDRLTVLYNACLRTGKTLVMLPYTAYILLKLKILSPLIPQYDMPQIRVFFEASRHTAKVISDKKLMVQLLESQIEYKDIVRAPEDIVVLDSYFVREQFAKKRLLENALCVYSKWQGYLKDEEQFWKDHCVPIKMIHTSGHANVNELKQLARKINPSQIIPIHTKNPDKFAEHFGKKVRVLSDGECIAL